MDYEIHIVKASLVMVQYHVSVNNLWFFLFNSYLAYIQITKANLRLHVLYPPPFTFDFESSVNNIPFKLDLAEVITC